MADAGCFACLKENEREILELQLLCEVMSAGGDSTTPTYEEVTISEMEEGSVLFAGPAGLVSQDNANLFWDDANNRLGIATNAPLTTLDVNGGIRVTGTYVVPISGTGLEFADVVTYSQILAYDRTLAAYRTMRVDGSVLLLNAGSLGNVAIGASSASARLLVKGAGLISQDFFHIEDSGGVRMLEVTSNPSGDAALNLRNTSGTAKILLETNGASYFIGGEVGIHTATPSAGAYLVVGGIQAGNAGLEIVPTSGVTLQSYNRVGGAYTSIKFDALEFGFRPSGSEKVTIDSTGNFGLDVPGPTHILSLGGNTARTFWMERHTTADNAGNNLSILAGGATAAATNKSAGILKLGGQLATGSGSSEVQILGTNGTNNGATTDVTPAVMIDVINNKIGFFTVTPVVRPTALTAQETTITFSEPGTPDYAIQGITAVTPFGFASANEGNTFIGVVENLQVRMAECEAKFKALGLLT